MIVDALIPIHIGKAELNAAFESMPGAITASNQDSALGAIVDRMHRRAARVVNDDRRTAFKKNRLASQKESMKFVLSSGIAPLIVTELNNCRNARCGMDEPTKISISTLEFPNFPDEPLTLPMDEKPSMMHMGQTIPTINLLAFRQAEAAVALNPIVGDLCIRCQGNKMGNPGCRFQNQI